MTADSEHLAVDSVAAPAAADRIAQAADLVRQAWATYGPRIQAVQALGGGDDARALQQKLAQLLQPLQDGVATIQDSCDSLAAQCKSGVGSFQDQDDAAARTLRA